MLGAMFRPNALKQRLRAGKRALGCWTVLGAPPVIELLALCGFDFLLLDQEHGFGEPWGRLHSAQTIASTPSGATPRGERPPRAGPARRRPPRLPQGERDGARLWCGRAHQSQR